MPRRSIHSAEVKNGSRSSGRLRLLDEPGHATVRVHAQKPEAGGVLLQHGNGRDRHVGAMTAMRFDQVAEVHPVKLVAGEDEHFVGVLALDVGDVLPHRVGRALIPVHALVRLLRREHFDEALAEHVELVRVRDVPVQADRKELREDVNVVQAAVDAVRDRDVDEPVLAGHGHGRLRARSREWVEPRAAAATQNESKDGRMAESLGETRTSRRRRGAAGRVDANTALKTTEAGR